MEKQTSKKRSDAPLNKGDVIGSFSEDDAKYLLYYGHNKDKTISIDDETWQIDYAIMQMFDYLKTRTHFNGDGVEATFWKRVRALANYR